jgi:hypothetical protein
VFDFLTHDVLVFLGVLAGFILLVLIIGLVTTFRKSELYNQYRAIFESVDDVIFNAIIFAGLADGFDEEKYKALADDFNKTVDLDLDPRMYYVITRAQTKLAEYGVTADILDLYERAEAIYQSVKRDPSNGIEL